MNEIPQMAAGARSHGRFVARGGIVRSCGFLRLFVFVALLQILDLGQSEAIANEKRLSILQGATDAVSTQVSVVGHKNRSYLLRLVRRSDRKIFPNQRSIRQEVASSSWIVEKASFSGLSLDDVYDLEVLTEDGNVVDVRELRTVDLERKTARIALASCMNDKWPGQDGMWDALLGVAPDLVFFTGDTVYADAPRSPAPLDQLWQRYTETRNRLKIYKAPRLVPIVATWDDHDYGDNNGNRLNPHKDNAKWVFETFFAQDEVPGSWTRGPGVSSRLEAFGQRFFFMDGRTFRTSKGEAEASHWGSTQESWVLSDLRVSPSPAWLINGSQFFGGYLGKESYEGDHPENFRWLLGELAQIAAPIVFVSGDVHFSELMRIEPEILGYETYEITSSAIHSLHVPDYHRRKKNPRRITAVSNKNFILVESYRMDPGLNLRATAIGSGGKVYFQKDLEVRR